MRAIPLLAAILCILPQTQAAATTWKLSTWNLNWLTLRQPGDPALPPDVHPRQPADFTRLHEFADKLDADVIAFQEVDGPQAAARIFDPAHYTLAMIDEDVIQRVGLAVRPSITVQRNPDLTALDVEPYAPHRLRFDATLHFPGGATLRILAVHLKTGCHTDDLAASRRPQCALLAKQIPILARWVSTRAAEPAPFAILGDFNRNLDDADTMEDALDHAAPLLRVTANQSDPCWGGGSFIDHIFLGGAARQWLVPGSLRVLTYHSTDEADLERLSDHCPVSIRLQTPVTK